MKKIREVEFDVEGIAWGLLVGTILGNFLGLLHYLATN